MKMNLLALVACCLLSIAVSSQAQQHTADCWLQNKSPYRSQTNFRGIQPTLFDLHSYMQSLAVKYTVPIEIMRA